MAIARPNTSALPQRSLKPSFLWQIREEIPRQLAWILMVSSISLPLVLWAVISNAGLVDPLFLPTPQQTLAALISAPLGVLMGSFRTVRSLMEPIIGIVRYMPAPAFIPLLIIYFGLGEPPKILLIFIGTLFFNTLMIMDGVKFVPKELIETTYTLGGSRRQVLLKVILPHVLPCIIDAFRVNMAASWNLVIVAELVAATEGLGRRISLAQRFLKTDEIFAGLIVIGLIGLAIDLLFRLLLRLSCRWAAE